MKHSAYIVEPGTAYFDTRRHRVVFLAHTHAAVVCRVPDCEWSLHMPARFGLDHLDTARRQHLTTAHFTGLLTGEVVLSPTTFDPCSSGPAAASFPPDLQGGRSGGSSGRPSRRKPKPPGPARSAVPTSRSR